MSRNVGHVIFQGDNSIAYMIFNSTVEQCYPGLYETCEKASKAFMNGTFLHDDLSCTCGGEEPVVIVPYDAAPVPPDSTIHWRGTGCRKCRCILSGLTDLEKS